MKELWKVTHGAVTDSKGQLVAAVPTYENLALIAEAPRLYEALKALVWADTHGVKNCTAQVEAIALAQEVLKSVDGE